MDAACCFLNGTFHGRTWQNWKFIGAILTEKLLMSSGQGPYPHLRGVEPRHRKGTSINLKYMCTVNKSLYMYIYIIECYGNDIRIC